MSGLCCGIPLGFGVADEKCQIGSDAISWSRMCDRPSPKLLTLVNFSGSLVRVNVSLLEKIGRWPMMLFARVCLCLVKAPVEFFFKRCTYETTQQLGFQAHHHHSTSFIRADEF